MAIYENQCTKCNHQFETLTKKPTDEVDRCPQCGSIAKRLISPNTFQLKDGGCGWADEGYSNK
jgi:putative FmdB family regulatory protein